MYGQGVEFHSKIKCHRVIDREVVTVAKDARSASHPPTNGCYYLLQRVTGSSIGLLLGICGCSYGQTYLEPTVRNENYGRLWLDYDVRYKLGIFTKTMNS